MTLGVGTTKFDSVRRNEKNATRNKAYIAAEKGVLLSKNENLVKNNRNRGVSLL